jgi:hypothetical protein
MIRLSMLNVTPEQIGSSPRTARIVARPAQLPFSSESLLRRAVKAIANTFRLGVVYVCIWNARLGVSKIASPYASALGYKSVLGCALAEPDVQ